MTDRIPHEAAMPLDGPLVDTYGRVADDLRISVTDRCNFRCTYCMPAEGLAWLPKHEILTFEELTRVLGIFVRLGVRSLKVTGGEPLVRADLPVLVRMFRRSAPTSTSPSPRTACCWTGWRKRWRRPESTERRSLATRSCGTVSRR